MRKHTFETKTLSDAFEYRIRKQGVHDASKYRTIASIAESLVGIHSARVQSPAAAILARSNHQSIEHIVDDLGQRDVIKIRCVRGTLHYCGLDTAKTMHKATLKSRIRLCNLMKRKLQLSEDVWAFVEAQIAGSLGTQLLGSLEIERRCIEAVSKQVGDSLLARQAIRVALKALWEKGDLFSENKSASFGKEDRVYGATPHHFHGFDLNDISDCEAVRQLVRSYFGAFGPASLKDFQWWSGIGRAETLQALDYFEQDLVSVRFPDATCELFMCSEDLADFLEDKTGKQDAFAFLAWEDSALKAYFETRHRYVEPSHMHLLFNQIGEARAAILKNGKAVGVWSWDRRTGRIRASFFDELPAKDKEAATAEMARLEAALSFQSGTLL